MINVSEPFLPPIDEYLTYLRELWVSRRITNNGVMVSRLEAELRALLGVKNLCLLANGTSALIAGLSALDLEGEVITTPFTFVATAQAIKWANLTPRFVDIDRESLTLDPAAVQAVINDKTCAILGVHVYGRTGDVNGLQEIASTHGIPLLFDAAHAFGVADQGGSVFRHGDVSVLSFHATKVFHTIEGGAVISNNEAVHRNVERFRNFGLIGQHDVGGLGMNAKMSEFHAAMGLAQMPYVESCQDHRRRVHQAYIARLNDVEGVALLSLPSQATSNYSYFPILVRENYGIYRDDLAQRLAEHGVATRRYFYPLISNLPMFATSSSEDQFPVASSIANRVLCLPMHAQLKLSEIDYICDLIQNRGKSNG